MTLEKLQSALMKMAAPATQPGAATLASEAAAPEASAGSSITPRWWHAPSRAVANTYLQAAPYIAPYTSNSNNPFKWAWNPLKWGPAVKTLYRGGFGKILTPFFMGEEAYKDRSVPYSIKGMDTVDRIGRTGAWAMPMAGTVASYGALAQGLPMAAATASARALGPIGWLGAGAAYILNKSINKMHEAWRQEDTADQNAKESGKGFLTHLVMMKPELRAKMMHDPKYRQAAINAAQAAGGKPSLWQAANSEVSPVQLARLLGVSNEEILNRYNPSSQTLAPGMKNAIQTYLLNQSIADKTQSMAQNMQSAKNWAAGHKGQIGLGLGAGALVLPALQAMAARKPKEPAKSKKKKSNE